MSFLDGLKLDGGAHRALLKDLELRRSTAGPTRWLGYHYKGSADLLLRHGKFYGGRQIPDEYAHLMGQPNRCYINAVFACQAEPSLRYCEGFYTTGFGSPRSHGWCVAPDGGVVEVTMPSDPDELCRYMNSVHMRYLPTEKWGYYGAIFDVRLADAHGQTLGLPMFDRSPAEIAENAQPGQGLDMSEPHDYPVLKVQYDPTRTEVPHG